MSTQRFVDALSGADGTQALRLRYEVPPVYPDATVPIAATRPAAPAPRVTVRVPEIDPQVARAVNELAAVGRPAADRAARPGRHAEPRPPRPPAAPPPTRAQAARADYYRGPMPAAVAPAEAARHQRLTGPVPTPFPAAPPAAGGLTAQAGRLRAQLSQFGQQFGTGNPRTAAPAPSSPQMGPRSSVPPPAFVPPAAPLRPHRRRSNGIQMAVFILFFLLVATGLGGQLVDVLGELIRR